MARRFVVIRPYGESIRRRVFAFLDSLGYEILLLVDRATPNDQLVQRLANHRFDLLLAPFHLHRDSNGQVVDGLQALRCLARAGLIRPGIPVLMPVSVFEAASRFERRLKEFSSDYPRIADQVVPMRIAEIGSDTIVDALKRIAEAWTGHDPAKS